MKISTSNTQPRERSTASGQWIRSRIGYAVFLTAAAIVLLMSMLISISVGVAGGNIWDFFTAIFQPDTSPELSQIMLEMRLPRALAACVTGAAFALAGTVMQGITRNPLADAGLLGINAGACFLVALCTAAFPMLSSWGLMGAAFFGAALAAAMVYGFGAKRKKADPICLILAGSAVSAFLTALSQGISLAFGLSKDLSFWTVGSLSGVLWPQVRGVIPWLLAGAIPGLLLSPKLSLLALGDESAEGLGVNVGAVRVSGLAIVLVLAGVSVSLVGGISFVGLIVPHMVRRLVGADYRRMAPAAMLLGAVLLVLSDVAARMIHAPFDTPVGALVSVIGVPVFLLLTYRNGRAAL